MLQGSYIPGNLLVAPRQIDVKKIGDAGDGEQQQRHPAHGVGVQKERDHHQRNNEDPR